MTWLGTWDAEAVRWLPPVFSGTMTRAYFPWLACLWGLAGVGCSGEPSAAVPAGAASDSAGVRIVDLSDVPASPTRRFDVDRSWLEEMDLDVGRLGDADALPGGGAVLLDEMSGTISVVSPGGELLRAFGRLGEGPGEFSPHGGISRVVVTDSSFVIPDIQLQRITEFSLDGEVISVRTAPEFDPVHGPVHGVDWRAHPEGGIAFRALGPTGDLILRAHEGALDTLHALEIPAPRSNLLLPATAMWDLGPHGELVVGRSDQGRIEMWMPGEGAPTWIARWKDGAGEVLPRERVHLEELLLASAEAQGLGSLPADQREQMLSSVTFPDSIPVVASVLADERGRTWVQEAAPITHMGPDALRVGSAAGFGGTEWRVLGRDGLLEERVRLPRGFTPRRFRGDCMIGILEDDLGVQGPARVCVPDLAHGSP
jgi:hypothetical protein